MEKKCMHFDMIIFTVTSIKFTITCYWSNLSHKTINFQNIAESINQITTFLWPSLITVFGNRTKAKSCSVSWLRRIWVALFRGRKEDHLVSLYIHTSILYFIHVGCIILYFGEVPARLSKRFGVPLSVQICTRLECLPHCVLHNLNPCFVRRICATFASVDS